MERSDRAGRVHRAWLPVTSEQPSGSQRVCPRCGRDADDAAFCGGCGLNLRKQKALPTADAFAASVREKRWLEEPERRALASPEISEQASKGEREQRPAPQAAVRTDQERQQSLDQATQPKLTRRPRTAARGRRLPIGLTVVILLLLGVGAGAVLLREDNGEAPGSGDASRVDEGPSRPPAPTEEEVGDQSQASGDESVSEDREGQSDSGGRAAGGYPRDCGRLESGMKVLIDGGDVSCEEARDVLENLGQGESPDGGVTILYKGWECGGASVIGCRAPDGAIRGQAP